MNKSIAEGLAALLLLIVSGCGTSPGTTGGMEMSEGQNVSVKEQVLNSLEGYSRADFVEVDAFEQIVNDAYFESRTWTNRVFGEGNDPGNDKFETRVAYHIWRGEQPGFDLLRHEYTLDTKSIVIIESVPLFVVWVSIDKTGEEHETEPAVRARETAKWLLGLDASFVEGNDGFLSTNPDLEEGRIRRWQDRIDARVTEKGVQLVIYKKDPMASPAPRNLTVWFDEEFRADPPRKRNP